MYWGAVINALKIKNIWKNSGGIQHKHAVEQ